MSGYQYGRTTLDQQIRAKRAELAALEQRIREARHTVPPLPKRTYKPRPETLAAAQKIDLTHLPTPIHGGPLGLRRAAAEIAAYNARHRKEAA